MLTICHSKPPPLDGTMARWARTSCHNGGAACTQQCACACLMAAELVSGCMLCRSAERHSSWTPFAGLKSLMSLRRLTALTGGKVRNT